MVAAFVLAVAFGACDPFRVRDPIPLPCIAAEVADVAGFLSVDIHVVAADAPELSVDGLGNRDLAGLGVGFWFRFGRVVRVLAVVEVRPLARHGDGEAEVAVGEGDRAVLAVDVVVSRTGDEDGVPVLEAGVMRTRIALEGRELDAGKFVAGPDDEIRGGFLEHDEVVRRGNRVRRGFAIVLREALDGENVVRKGERSRENRRCQSGDKRKDKLFSHSCKNPFRAIRELGHTG